MYRWRYVYIDIYLCGDAKVEEWLDGRISLDVGISICHCANTQPGRPQRSDARGYVVEEKGARL